MNQNWKISQYCENPQKYDLSNYQDACASYTDGEVSVMALCGGASAGMHSHIGASCIAEFSAQYFAEHFDDIYDADFNVVCAELTNYHQAMIGHLATVAFERKNVQILVNRTIQLKELNKFASTVQILAVKEDKAIYFKVGNGSAAVASGDTLVTLSESVLQNPEIWITTPNPIYVLINCDFKTFTLSPSCYALSLATDGVEFETGLFFEHSATPFYQKLIEDVCDAANDPEEELKKAICSLLNDNMNTAKDNIGISVMYRDLPKESEPENSERATEEADMDNIPLVDIGDDIMDEMPVSELTEEITDEATEEVAIEEITDEATEEVTIEEITEEATEEEVIEEITEEATIEEITEEATEEEVIEEITEEATIEEITEEATEEEVIEEITEEAT
ncbi:MAG: protein phosphatase 2C domain-containing protein, partial [Clostridia bacterium]|nr:protein phosphatase 2C domain-containing protein [Clostridia bacterium]